MLWLQRSSFRSFTTVLSLATVASLSWACTPSASSGPTTQVMNPPGARARDAGMDPPKLCASADALAGDSPKDCTWNVDDPPGDEQTIPLAVDSGTWMNLDLSPDGQTIVFDLLGDLYLLPIAGGQAKPLTEGMAWDMQPRFSPDGQWLAFTSDRGGGDNIWVLAIANGAAVGEPKPVTNEDFRLLSAPAWSPDGEYIVARKHFTSTRSIGAGEMWLYHRSGGKGVQLTEKRTDQKDSGEPVFSPDGRYLYFSEDLTPGKVFDYNKDPNGQIYAIQRLDLQAGPDQERLETILGGSGGAVRPTPSPDGTMLAYVRRVRLKSVLYVRELETGVEWPIHDGLDRDMQETWAIHGVYPQMAWTPDSSAIVFWAGGKLHKIGAREGELSEIPFRVDHSRKVSKPARFPVEVAPAQFDVKAIRWPQQTPDGSKLVYQALGKIYVRDMKTGEVRRLTNQSHMHEYYPSVSRDGEWVVYVAWDDAKLGSIRATPINGGGDRAIVSTPGHYVEPVLSPDNTHVVFRKVRGGGLVSPRGPRETGIYARVLEPLQKAVPRHGSRAVLPGTKIEFRLSQDGFEPQFGADSDRVFFQTEGPEDARVLASVGLDGQHRREHLTSKRAEQFAVAPDGRWVAFVEGFRVYAAAFPQLEPQNGKPLELGPDGGGLPVTQISKDAGWFVHWSRDSKSLHWLLGPELHTRSLDDAFEFLNPAKPEADKPKSAPEPKPTEPEPKPEPKITKQNIGFSVPSNAPTGKLALVGGTLVTMKGDEVILDGAVVIEANRITAIGPRSSVTIPSDAKVIDVTGHTLTPGLVDVHAHGSQAIRGIQPEQNWLHYAELGFGVTTVHDPSNDSLEIFSTAELVRAGEAIGPRIFSTGTILYGAEGSFRAEVQTVDDARMHMRRMQAIGAISVKSYNQPRRDQRQKVLQAARELGMMVVPEGGSLYQHNMTMVVDGHTGVEHAIPVAAVYADVEALWGGTPVGYTPTLVVAYGGVWGENYWYQHTDVWNHERLMSYVPRDEVDARSRRRMHVGENDWNHVAAASVAKQLTDAGVAVNLGAHGQREGLAAHWELWMFVQGGMTPHEALRAGTINGARYVGLDGDLGSLEVGKLADIMVVAGDVLADIRVSENVKYTVINGRIYEAATMAEIGNHPGDPNQLWWQIDGESRPAGSLAIPPTSEELDAELDSHGTCRH